MPHELPLDFVVSFCQEMIPTQGEDCYCYSFCDTAGMLGVFDGCGGAGARKHDYYSGHTEAYMSSRLCSGAFYDAFRRVFPCDKPVGSLLQDNFIPTLEERLKSYLPPKEETEPMIKGSMIRTLPSTAAMALVQMQNDKDLLLSSIWAGDSRVYLLDSHGLAQLTIDDTSVPNPMENIYEDGILNNVLCSDRAVKLNCRTLKLQAPFAVICATDGCFGYVSTPMEFEGIILASLLSSNSVEEWKTKLCQTISAISGDDHSICIASFGFHGFDALKKSFDSRYKYIKNKYIIPVSRLNIDDRQSRYELWKDYSTDYLKYIKDVIN